MTSEAQKKAIAKYESTQARILIRITPEEKKKIEKRAAENSMSVNQWVKTLIFKEL